MAESSSTSPSSVWHRVVKVGGSLFDLADLPARLRDWLASQPRRRTLWLAGGGKLADVVRDLDAQFQLGEEQAHELAVTILGTSARLLAALLADQARLITSPDELTKQLMGDAVFDPQLFLATIESALPGAELPQTWDVTSDSIAARVAQYVGARELVLLKSRLPPAGSDRITAATSGYVDRFLPHAAAQVGIVRCIDLRDSSFPELIISRG